MVQGLTGSQLKKIGKAVADGSATPEQLDVLDAFLARHDEVQAAARDLLDERFRAWRLLSGGEIAVQGRTKTLTTLREKLVRDGGYQLPRIRDLAGLRLVGDMTLPEQDAVAAAACLFLGATADEVKVIDRREQPKYGYRALHLEVPIEDVTVELQVRTLLQHQWAEIIERVGDRMGRDLRYRPPTELPPPVGQFAQLMQQVSTTTDVMEKLDSPGLLKARLAEVDEHSEEASVLRGQIGSAERAHGSLRGILLQARQYAETMTKGGAQ